MKTIWSWQSKLETASEANCCEDWRVKWRRHKKQKLKIKVAFLQERPSIAIPCRVVLTRISPRQLDEHDNLRMCFKWIADAIAEYLIPGKAAGRADDSKAITWEYKQEKGSPQAVRIEIMSDS